MTSAAFLVLTLLLTCEGQDVPEPPESEEPTEGPSQPPQAQYPIQYPAKIYPRGFCPSYEEMANFKNEFRQNISELLMIQSCGGPSWRRVAYLDMTDPSQSCPPGLNLTTYSSRVRACGRVTNIGGGCWSTFYMTGDAEYSRVCGRVRGYQYSGAFAFLGTSLNQGIDGYYVSGVSLTHGQSGSRTHIWTFAASQQEADTAAVNLLAVCPCVTPRPTSSPPDFVGSDYFCESGTDVYSGGAIFYADDPLWDGQNCTSSCCEFNNPPYFTKTLPTPTTDDIELRICTALPTSDVPIDQVEIYVQ